MMVAPKMKRLRAIAGFLAMAVIAASCTSAGESSVEDSTTAAPTTVAPTTTAAPTTEAPTTTEATTTTVETTTTSVPVAAPDEQALPEDPGALAEAITEAERAVRDEAIGAEEAMAWGRRQQALYRVLSANPEWATGVLEGVGPDVLRAYNSNWVARQNLSALVNSTNLATSLPAWRLNAPLPADELLAFYKEAEAQTGVGWEYLAAINLVETRMGRIEGLSTAGATGPMQFLPATWAECCEGDVTNDRDAIIGAGVYLRARGFEDSVDDAIFGYNNSQRYVDAVKAYAEVMRSDELAYRGYHAWQVYFLSASGLILMPEGYEQTEPIEVDEWLAANPDALISGP